MRMLTERVPTRMASERMRIHRLRIVPTNMPAEQIAHVNVESYMAHVTV